MSLYKKLIIFIDGFILLLNFQETIFIRIDEAL